MTVIIAGDMQRFCALAFCLRPRGAEHSIKSCTCSLDCVCLEFDAEHPLRNLQGDDSYGHGPI